MRDNNIIQDAINCITILKYEIRELKAENEKLRALCDTYRTCYQAKYNDIDSKLFKYRQTLQDIKTIAEDNIDCTQYEIDHDCFNDTRCKALREQIEILQQILELITKAESEKQTNENGR